MKILVWNMLKCGGDEFFDGENFKIHSYQTSRDDAITFTPCYWTKVQ